MPLPADLAVVSAVASKLTPSAGQPMMISGAISNLGDGPAPASVASVILTDASSSTLTADAAILPLAAGARLNFDIKFRAPETLGEHAIEVCISQVPGEPNVNNNCIRLAAILVRESAKITPILPLLLED